MLRQQRRRDAWEKEPSPLGSSTSLRKTGTLFLIVFPWRGLRGRPVLTFTSPPASIAMVRRLPPKDFTCTRYHGSAGVLIRATSSACCGRCAGYIASSSPILLITLRYLRQL